MVNSVRSRWAKFKRLRHFAALASLLMAGCAAIPTSPTAPRSPPPRQPLDRLVVATPDADHDVIAQLLSGEMALVRGDLPIAAAAFARAAPLSGDPKIAERAAALALAVHNAAGARAAIARWQALGAKPTELAAARAQLALDTGDSDQARRQLERLLATGGEDAWRQFGRVLAGARDQAQAAQLLESIATPQRLPADPKAWLAMSELGERFNRNGYALTVANAAAARFKSGETYAWSARLKFKTGDHAGARAMLKKAIAADPKDTQLRLAYATMLAQDGDYATAATWLAHGPQTNETYALRTALAAQKNDRKSLAALYREIKQAPAAQRDQNAFLLGQLAEMQNLNDQALAWYDQVGDDDPHAFDADLRSAVIVHGQGQRAQAHELLGQLETAYLSQPTELRRAYEADASLYMTEQHYAQAETAFGRALQVMPNDPALLYGRGLAYAEGGKIDQAVADLRQLLKLKPDDVDASNALGYTLADAGRDLPEAQRLLETARKAKPDDPAIADSWGWLQYRLGHLPQAAQTLRQAWAARPDADVGVHLGVVLWHQGDQASARQVFDQVRKLDPGNRALHDAMQRLHP